MSHLVRYSEPNLLSRDHLIINIKPMKHNLFIEFMLQKRDDKDKLWFWYRVYGTPEAIEHYQQTHATPMISRTTGVPMFGASIPLGKCLKLRYDERGNRYYGDLEEYNMYASMAKQYRGDADMFKYYMDLAEERRSLVIPQELRDMPVEAPEPPPTEITAPSVNSDVDNSTANLSE